MGPLNVSGLGLIVLLPVRGLIFGVALCPCVRVVLKPLSQWPICLWLCLWRCFRMYIVWGCSICFVKGSFVLFVSGISVVDGPSIFCHSSGRVHRCHRSRIRKYGDPPVVVLSPERYPSPQVWGAFISPGFPISRVPLVIIFTIVKRRHYYREKDKLPC